MRTRIQAQEGMTRRAWSKLHFVLFLLLVLPGAAWAQEPLPGDKAAWIERLARITDPQGDDHWVMNRLVTLDPALSYEVLRDGWERLSVNRVKVTLLNRFAYADVYLAEEEPARPRPSRTPARPTLHLLDILHLGATDASAEVQQAAFGFLFGIAFQDFPDQSAYLAWREQTAGQSLEALVEGNCRAFLAKLRQADDRQRSLLLDQLNRLPLQYGSSQSLDGSGRLVSRARAPGLIGLRRAALLEAGLLEAVGRGLRAESSSEVVDKTIRFLAAFQPGEAFLTRYEDDLRREIERRVRGKEASYDVYALLAACPGRWAVEVQTEILQKEYNGRNCQLLVNSLLNSSDLRVIPTLIAMLEVADRYHAYRIRSALTRLTGTGDGPDQDADWWRAWWRRNRQTLPAEARNLTIPRLAATRNEQYFAIRRRKTQIQIGDDPRRVYWLIASGVLLKRQSAPQQASLDDWADIPKAARPGLIVVLADTDPQSDAWQMGWQKTLERAFQGGYLVALAVPPRWRDAQTPMWLTKREKSRFPQAAFTTETFVREIARDVQTLYPINPDRVFLHGIGAAGLAAYACSLEPQTPFKGFYLLSANFRSAQLPPLQTARNRRYFLRHDQADKTYPSLLAHVAESMLKRAGATVKLVAYRDPPERSENAPDWQPTAEAIRWLEMGSRRETDRPAKP